MNTKIYYHSKLILISILLGVSAKSNAQNRAFITPIGASEGLAGNTGIGRYGSVGAVIYNPAGLAGIKSNKVSASASAFSYNAVKITEKDTPESSNRYFETIPTQVTTVFNQGKFTWAASILVPYSMQMELKQYQNLENFSDSVLVDSYIKMQETLLGLSAGFSLNPKYKIGLSIFGAKTDGYSRASAFLSESGNDALISVKQDMSAISIYPILGFLALESKSFAWGIRLSGPSLQLSGKEKMKEQQVNNFGSSSINKEVERDFIYRKPIDLGFGMTWVTSPRFKFFADISAQSSQKYNRYKEDGKGDQERIKEEGYTRLGLGVEYKISRFDAITLGVISNQNMNKEKSGDFGDYMGGTIGYRSISNRVTTSVGFYALSSTNDQDENGEVVDVQTHVKSNIYGLFISTTYRL